MAKATPNLVSDIPDLLVALSHQLPLLDARRAGAELHGAPRLSLFELLKPNERQFLKDRADTGFFAGKYLTYIHVYRAFSCTQTAALDQSKGGSWLNYWRQMTQSVA